MSRPRRKDDPNDQCPLIASGQTQLGPPFQQTRTLSLLPGSSAPPEKPEPEDDIRSRRRLRRKTRRCIFSSLLIPVLRSVCPSTCLTAQLGLRGRLCALINSSCRSDILTQTSERCHLIEHIATFRPTLSPPRQPVPSALPHRRRCDGCDMRLHYASVPILSVHGRRTSSSALASTVFLPDAPFVRRANTLSSMTPASGIR